MWWAHPDRPALDSWRQKKYGTASAGLVRQCGTHMEKTRKCLPAVASLQAGRSSRAGLQANPQTPGSPLPLRRRRRDSVTSVLSAPSDGGFAHDDMRRCAQGMTGARLRCGCGAPRMCCRCRTTKTRAGLDGRRTVAALLILQVTPCGNVSGCLPLAGSVRQIAAVTEPRGAIVKYECQASFLLDEIWTRPKTAA